MQTKHQSLEAEVDFVQRHFANHQLVSVSASELWDSELGDPQKQIAVDIVAPRAHRTVEAERERESALYAALIELLESLPIVKSAKRIGWVDSDKGLGDCYLVTLNLTEWRVGSDGRLYRH